LALGLALAVLVPYIAVLAAGRSRIARIPLPASWLRWLDQAVGEEEAELSGAIGERSVGAHDGVVVLLALVVVVGASVAMERAAVGLGRHYAVAPIIVGGLLLAAVTSLPNAVAGIYLATRSRGAAALSTALNSNVLNSVAGLLIPGTIIGLGAPSGQATLVALAYLTLTVLVLGAAYLAKGLRRGAGALIVATYAGFTVALIATAT
jgi:Ca2+/Na+ antiporter